jgi:hypothetical protein
MQCALHIREEGLIIEAMLRLQCVLAPMLGQAHRSPAMLGPALLAALTSVAQVRNVIQDSFVGQEQNRVSGVRTSAAIFVCATQLLQAASEGQCSSHVAEMRIPLLQAYDPRVKTEGKTAAPR